MEDFHHQCYGPTQWLEYENTNCRTMSLKLLQKEEGFCLFVCSPFFLELWSISSKISFKAHKALLCILVDSKPLLTWFTALISSVICSSLRVSLECGKKAFFLIYHPQKFCGSSLFSTYSNRFLSTLRLYKEDLTFTVSLISQMKRGKPLPTTVFKRLVGYIQILTNLPRKRRIAASVSISL